AGRRSAAAVLRNPRSTRHEEEAVHLGIVGLAEIADGRGHRPGNLARARPEEADPASARRAVEERAGRASVRAAGVHGKAGGAVGSTRAICSTGTFDEN